MSTNLSTQLMAHKIPQSPATVGDLEPHKALQDIIILDKARQVQGECSIVLSLPLWPIWDPRETVDDSNEKWSLTL